MIVGKDATNDAGDTDARIRQYLVRLYLGS
jgi:hypothetical protein